ncbi:MAG TPA: hypothetical protein VK131_08670 [Candidatus Acidoferrales bacterium]|nr:hypothetical protein [Candidatus Acidoferrales bacterium]
MSALALLHRQLAFALILYAAVLGVWGAYQYFRHRRLSGGFRSSYLLLVALTGLQGLAGLAAGLPHNLLHLVYGIFAVVFLPGLYFYTARGGKDREAAFLTAACWVVEVAYLRGLMTAH